MIEVSGQWPMVAFLVFCRVGGCIMLMPGPSSLRVPVRVRLYVALAICLMVLPLVKGGTEAFVARTTPLTWLVAIASESATGLLLGLLSRTYLLALHFAGSVVAVSMGYNSPPVTDVEDGEATSTVANVITLTASLLIFVTDIHVELIKTFVQSFSTLPMGVGIASNFPLTEFVDLLGRAYLLSLQVAAPFVIYSILVNVLIGAVNRMIVQVPLQMVATPVVLLGGLALLALLSGAMLSRFEAGFIQWLARGS